MKVDRPVYSVEQIHAGCLRRSNAQDERAGKHAAQRIRVSGPVARVALRWPLGRRALRPPASGSFHLGTRCRRRSCIHRARGAARPHGSGPCHQLLGDRHHAEDAFQAVFLVLARKARSIRDPDLLANWLYGVALRTARCAKIQLDRRRKREGAGIMLRHGSGTSLSLDPIVHPPEQPVIDREQAEALHSEIARLPGSFRKPLVLCYFEGLTLDEAARRLRCPTGTLRSRIARARDKLKRGLTRRGVLPAAALTALLSPRSASASVSSRLCETTARAAIQFAAGQFAAPLALEVLRSMLFHKLKSVALTLLFLDAVATSAGYLTRALARNDEPKSPVASRQTPAAPKLNDTAQKPAPGRMFVVGRVLDPQGKPVAGAAVMASALPRFSRPPDRVEGRAATVIAHAKADISGRFRLDSPRTSSSRDDEFITVALAPGYGAGWVRVDPDADEPAGDISLQPEQVVQGRLLDLTGRPAQGVVVSVSSIRRSLASDAEHQFMARVTTEGPIFWWAQVIDLPAWPKPATTDADGRFTVHGVGRGLEVQLNVVDPRFAPQTIKLATDDTPGAKVVSSSLQPARTITGRVTFADTGGAVPQARIAISGGGGQRGARWMSFQTDAEGRFRANAWSGDSLFVTVFPPPGQPYLAPTKRVDWPKGAVEQTINLALPRGVAVHGKVTEEGSARPVAGASVLFMPHARAAGEANSHNESETAADGSFELAAPPGAGHLAVLAPTEDYVLREIGNREFLTGSPGGRRIYSHSFVACDPQQGGTGLSVNIALRRGMTILGRLIGPDEKPLKDGWIIGRAALGQSSSALRTWQGRYHRTATNGRFELQGLDPEAVLPTFFLEPKRRLGATAHLSAKSAAGGPITIRLEPCGTATARLVDGHGQPVAGYREELLISMIITPGPDSTSRDPADARRIVAERDFVVSIDPINYAKAPASDAQGRITFPALIPGASYRITDRTAVLGPSGPQVRKDFTVKPGETLDLGDIVIEKPR